MTIGEPLSTQSPACHQTVHCKFFFFSFQITKDYADAEMGIQMYARTNVILKLKENEGINSNFFYYV